MARKHGTCWAYRCGCRCVECRAANAAAHRAWYARRKVREPDYRREQGPRLRTESLGFRLDDDRAVVALFASVGVQAHMIEWCDPTADAALAGLAS